jgi:putative transposase
MNSVSSELKSFCHYVGQNWYHIVLIPRRRYPVFRQEHQNKLCCEAIDYVCKRHNIDLFAKEVMDDHVHLFVSCPPTASIRKLAQLLKGGSSYYIRKNHLPLKKYPALWSKGFMYRSVGSVSSEIVKNYIQNSNKWLGGQQRLS